jgi:DNA-binding response OmpR family regulator
MDAEIIVEEAHEHTVLVVDDDDTLRTMVCRALAERFNVEQAADAQKALALLDTIEVPDVIVCDVMMPGTNGFDLAKQIRKIPRFQRVPIVFLTAKTSALDVIEGINAGARSYVTKPFKMGALVERLQKILTAPARRA